MTENFHFRRLPFLLGISGIILLTVLTAAVQYRNTQLLLTSRNWVEHTQQVLAALESADESVHRSISDEQLYRATHSAIYQQQRDQERAHFSSILQQLAALVAGTPPQEAIARSLIEDFARQMDLAAAASNAQIPVQLDQRPEFSRKIAAMRTTERQLLQARLAVANRRAHQCVLATALFLAITIAIILKLFLLLWRDSLRRRGFQTELLESNQRLQATVVEMQRNARFSAISAAASEELQISMEPQECYKIAARFFAQLAPHSSGALALISNSRQMVEAVSSWGDGALFPETFSLEACCALRSGRQRWHSTGSNEIHCSHHLTETAPEFYFCLPLAAHGETLGAVLMQFRSLEALKNTREHQTSLEELGEMVAMSIANLNLRQKLRNQSIRDELTGLFNRQFLQIAFERELHRARRNSLPLSVFMLDVDHFKQLNDTFGHDAGDAVLRELAQVMQRVVRAEDIVCRYGGEEFAIILPDMPGDVGFGRAETLRKIVEAMRIRSGENTLHPITVSIGTATYPSDGETPEKLLKAADENLYRAKRQGRNRTVADSTPGPLRVADFVDIFLKK